jgi:putative selenate reductase
MRRYGQLLETPLGVAAGPHTQLSQNLISAWLTGAGYLELKTVQVLDAIQVTKPCIDMTDEVQREGGAEADNPSTNT